MAASILPPQAAFTRIGKMAAAARAGDVKAFIGKQGSLTNALLTYRGIWQYLHTNGAAALLSFLPSPDCVDGMLTETVPPVWDKVIAKAEARLEKPWPARTEPARRTDSEAVLTLLPADATRQDAERMIGRLLAEDLGLALAVDKEARARGMFISCAAVMRHRRERDSELGGEAHG